MQMRLPPAKMLLPYFYIIESRILTGYQVLRIPRFLQDRSRSSYYI